MAHADPLQGVTPPDGFVPNNGMDDSGFSITAEDVADTVLDFVPIAGGVKDIYKGIRDGDGWQVAMGAGFVVLDVFTLGSASLVKGAVKTGVKVGGKALARNAARGVNVASSTGGRVLPMTVQKIIPQGSKISDIVNDVKGMTWMTGNEHAVVRLANGQKAIVSGGSGGISFKHGQIRTLFGHTHPTSAPPSLGDYNALRQLGQSRQYVLHGGQVSLIRH
ncbi:MAG: hypothetical protein AAFX53_17730 [Bacteroidota bacterium]